MFLGQVGRWRNEKKSAPVGLWDICQAFESGGKHAN
jgi:hypothetical protein